MRKNPIRYVWMALGILCLVLGTIGVVLPILPTVPFYMATVFCFAKGSRTLHDWFLGTTVQGLYSYCPLITGGESNDKENKEVHHYDGNDLNGNRFYHDEQRTDRPCSSCDRVDFSFLIFWIESRNCQRRESKGNNI